MHLTPTFAKTAKVGHPPKTKAKKRTSSRQSSYNSIPRPGYADFFRARTFAQRALCAAAIFARDLADILRLPVLPVPRYTAAKAVSAAFNPDNCFSTWSRSFFNCFTSPDKLAINSSLGEA